MDNSVSQSSNSNPTISWRTPTGQEMSGPLNSAPPQVQLLYQQLPQSSAQTSSAQAGAVTAGVAAAKAPATIDLGTDLTKNKISLPEALKKYTPLGMTPDDIFTQYKSVNKIPNVSPTELQNMGISSDAIGQIGQNGSYADRWNTKNAIEGIRDLKTKWNSTSVVSKALPFVGPGITPSGKAYTSGYNLMSSHLSSLIPGAPGGENTASKLSSSLPQLGDVTELEPGAAEGQFNSVEDQLLKAKGYGYKDLGLTSPGSSGEKTGGEILKSLLKKTFVEPVTNAAAKTDSENQNNIPESERKGNLLMSILGAGQDTANFAKNTVLNPQILGEAATLATLPDLAAGAVGAPEVLAKLLGKGGTKAVAGATPDVTAALKGNPVMDFINPDRAITRGGEVRDAIVNTATKSGNTINGSKIVADLEKAVPKLKMGNLGQGDIINRAIEDAGSAFKGKLTPEDLARAYQEADSGFTKAGAAKTAIQSNIDRALRDVLSKHLDDVAPGWEEATQAMAKGYKTIKSPVRSAAKSAIKFGLPIGAAGEGANILTHYLFGGK